MLIPERPAEGPLGARLPGYDERIRGQLLTPLRVSLMDLREAHYALALPRRGEVFDHDEGSRLRGDFGRPASADPNHTQQAERQRAVTQHGTPREAELRRTAC